MRLSPRGVCGATHGLLWLGHVFNREVVCFGRRLQAQRRFDVAGAFGAATDTATGLSLAVTWPRAIFRAIGGDVFGRREPKEGADTHGHAWSMD